MNAQIQRLEELLSRVQRNRTRSQKVGAPDTPSKAQPVPANKVISQAVTRKEPTERKPPEKAERIQKKIVPQQPVSKHTASSVAGISPQESGDILPDTQASQKKQGTPLQAAVEDHIVESSVSSTISPAVKPAQPIAPTPAAEVRKPIEIQAAAIVAEKSVVLQMSAQPKEEEPTFGTLLRRTLSLRQR